MSDSLVKDCACSCAFTGHRKMGESFDINLLNRAVDDLISKGYVNFYCGMAMGFDLIAAGVVLQAKKNHPQIKLIACVPCPKQQKYFPSEEKDKYERIISLCDKVEILSEKYYKGCMLARDRFMVDNSGCVLAYMNKTDGGTAYTVKYAKSKNKEIFII